MAGHHGHMFVSIHVACTRGKRSVCRVFVVKYEGTAWMMCSWMAKITDQIYRTRGYELDAAGSCKETVVSCCNYDNETWGSI